MAASMVCDGQFFEKISGYSLVFQDNGRVAYAYLQDENEAILGDVWLYNRDPAPIEPEWKDFTKIPFANPLTFVKNVTDFVPVSDISEVHVSWELKSGVLQANIFIRDVLFAKLAKGEKPGRSFLVLKNGPLANILEEI